MKVTFKLCLLLLLYWVQPLHLRAQEYSEWSVDPVRKWIKARYMKFKATDGYNWIRLQIVSSKEDCRMELTSTLCNADPKDRNKWQSIHLKRNAVKTVSFKILNSCINGWWWWYQRYKADTFD